MADRRLTPEPIPAAGLAATYLSDLLTADTHQISNDGRVILHFKKSGAGSCTVTVLTARTIGGLAVADPTKTVPATTGDLFIGPFPAGLYNNGDGDVEMTVSEVTGLTLALIRVP